ncbi:alpha/beta hydrolase-fold protein [Sphingobacterium sp. lm-10]|uniref:alpha/beta hydrolase n=1 Tax=Sphingobacterium sp. lm-10 TaxID=2944904 RepID=UPI002020F4D7|nr:alpha/beta hydrolase-fold protein [Sphingobacterium sp. lm-10]MCL7987828.1 alpha/beta hydrolase-fold protein [Sphingobacterium sp. lm-10]
MIGKPIIFSFLLLLFLGNSACREEKEAGNETKQEPIRVTELVYSTHVRDTFAISTQYPKAYDKDSLSNYPVVVLTDADLYFPLLAPILHQYEEVGIWPPIILVGIGYGSFERMDSLRNRDYLYPEALASDEITGHAGGEDFYQFLTQELIPKLKGDGLTHPKRMLMGHSFGGYFSLYAYLRQAELKRQDFAGFLSASPSLWYHDFYLSKLLTKQLSVSGDQEIFLTVGGQEDAEWGLKPFDQIVQGLEELTASQNLHSQVYTGLGHMDVALISFLQGIPLLLDQ